MSCASTGIWTGRRAIYTRNGAGGRIEIIATNLDTSEEALLLKANARTENATRLTFVKGKCRT
jgi:hypothetical protein